MIRTKAKNTPKTVADKAAGAAAPPKAAQAKR